MAGKSRDKDKLREHSGLVLVESISPPELGDPLRWWTLHETEAIEVNLHSLADGEFENRHPYGPSSGNWPGPFTGRPNLVRELAPILKARTLLASRTSVENYLGSLRMWWRLFDAIEAKVLPGGRRLERIDSVADLSPFHESGAHQSGMSSNPFSQFRLLANAARLSMGLRKLNWDTPERKEPDRQLITDEMARSLRIAMKRNWVGVIRGWQLRDRVRAEAGRRDAGELACDLGEEGERLLINWVEFRRIVEKTGEVIPSGKQLLDGRDASILSYRSISRSEMRSIQFPTVWDMDSAYHLALLDSGWNPSTMLNLDARDPNCVAPSLKDGAYLVLSGEDDDALADGDLELKMSAPKPRARGKLQTCSGLAKNSCSPPVVVSTYLKRSEPLRAILRHRLEAAVLEHERLKEHGDTQAIAKAFLGVQELRQGVRSVWVYVDKKGAINWPSGRDWKRYSNPEDGKVVTFISVIALRLASDEGRKIGHVKTSDLRDLYARFVLHSSGGNIIAVMLALGHSRLGTTGKYLDNNIFKQENDQQARRFMDHLFAELDRGRVDLTILSQLCRNGPLTAEMDTRLREYRSLMQSRIGVGCADPRHPPVHIEPEHRPGRLCAAQRCGLCDHGRYLPESITGIAMRAEELMRISDLIPREAWLRLRFDEELERLEAVLDRHYDSAKVAEARDAWRSKIISGQHVIPGFHLGIAQQEHSA